MALHQLKSQTPKEIVAKCGYTSTKRYEFTGWYAQVTCMACIEAGDASSTTQYTEVDGRGYL